MSRGRHEENGPVEFKMETARRLRSQLTPLFDVLM